MNRRTAKSDRSLPVAALLALAIAGCTPDKPASVTGGSMQRPADAHLAGGWGPSVTIDRLNRELEELRALGELGDDEATATRFQPLLFRFLARAEMTDLRRMLRDPSPLVRVMSLFCLAYEPPPSSSDDPKFAIALRELASDGSILPNDIITISPPLLNENGPITVSQVAAFVRSNSARPRMPSLPINPPPNSTAGDCARLIRFCRDAVDAAATANAESQSPGTAATASRGDDAAAWIGLTATLAKHPQRNIFDRMLRDESPGVRAAGIVAIARSNQPDAVDVLSLALGDDGRTWPSSGLDPTGGLGSTVGDLAARVLTDPQFLPRLLGDSDAGSHGLLDDEARRVLILKMLAADGPISRQAALRASFAADMREAVNPVDALLAFVGQRDVVTLKAIGRGAFENNLSEAAIAAVRTFLISCVDDASLDAPARFAAASALTRDGSGSADSALTGAAAELDALAPEAKLGQRFVTEAKLREHLQTMSDATASNAATMPADMVELAAHPIVLSILRTRSLDRMRTDESFRKTAITSIDRIADRVDSFRSTWDTYSDSGFELDALLIADGSAMRNLIGEERVARWSARAKAAEASAATAAPSSSTRRP